MIQNFDPIHVYSEIGKLRKVLLHYPGREFENLVPRFLDKLLFDDIPYLKVAQQEHMEFSKTLINSGVEVLYIEKLLEETLNANSLIKEQFVDVFLKKSRIISPNLVHSIKSFFLNLSTQHMISYVFGGLRKSELKNYTLCTLSDHVNHQEPFYLYPMPNMLFTRDPLACIGNGISISVMHYPIRHRETLIVEYIFKYHPYYQSFNIPNWFENNMSTTLEGGDQLVLSNNVLAIGISERTEADSIEQVAHNLFNCTHNSFDTVLAIQIPSQRSFMHLDTVLTQVDRDKFLIFSGFDTDIHTFIIKPNEKKHGDFKIQELHDKLDKILGQVLQTKVTFIQCGNSDLIDSEREQWSDGANALAISPGEVVMYDRNVITNELLDKHGIKVHTISSNELSRGRGGPRCMSMPLQRDDI